MEVSIGPEIIRSYKRLSYTAWHAIAEFVDNSIQSYLNNRGQLDPLYAESAQRLTVRITYSQTDGGRLVINDNAMGMSQEELNNALRIGRAPEITSGLSEFGMGLKTAACWFGNRWELKTKKLGLEQGQSIVFDVEEVASGNLDLQHSTFPAPANEHYTRITIRDLNRFLHGAGIARVKRFLSSMYRVKIKEESLALSFNNESLKWFSPVENRNVHISEGEECLKEFEFDINDKKVSGWIAILEKGSRQDAGLTIIRRGRVIKGWPESWRPQTIYGQFEGSNDLVNQRLVGEVNLDEFGVSHTKDDILWDGNDEALVERELANVSEPFISIARSYRRRGVRGSFPSSSLVRSALNVLDEEITSPRFRHVIATNGSVPVAGYEAVAQSLYPSISDVQPDAVYNLPGLTLKVYLSEESSERNPYLGIDISPDDVLNVVINMKHPHVRDLSGRLGVLNHLKACTYEGVAQWKVRHTWNEDRPELIRVIKDALLRVGASIDDA